ncbi:MAG: hypothetical protein AAF902_01980 [Chloroflexota bacterium]
MGDEERMRRVIAELMWRNPIKHDGHAYELALCKYALGFGEKPDAEEFGQIPINDWQAAKDYIERLKED